MLDTNIVISAIIFRSSIPSAVLRYLRDNRYLVLCDYVINEL